MVCNTCKTDGSSLIFAFIWYPTPEYLERKEPDGYKCPSCGSRDIDMENR